MGLFDALKDIFAKAKTNAATPLGSALMGFSQGAAQAGPDADLGSILATGGAGAGMGLYNQQADTRKKKKMLAPSHDQAVMGHMNNFDWNSSYN